MVYCSSSTMSITIVIEQQEFSSSNSLLFYCFIIPTSLNISIDFFRTCRLAAMEDSRGFQDAAVVWWSQRCIHRVFGKHQLSNSPLLFAHHRRCTSAVSATCTIQKIRGFESHSPQSSCFAQSCCVCLLQSLSGNEMSIEDR